MGGFRLKSWGKRNVLPGLGIFIALAALALTGGCGGQPSAGKGDAANPKPEEHEPVTVRVGVKSTGYLSNEEFQRYFVEPVKKKFPWITPEWVTYSNSSLPQMVAIGDAPDIVITNNVNGMPQMEELALAGSIEDLIKAHKLDVSRIETFALDALKVASQRDELVGIPYTRHFGALYYNKDIFDKFAVGYPKDGMTWPQVTELARQVTRMEGGVQYRGLEPNVPERLASQLSLGFVDPKKKVATFNSDPWKKVLKQLVDIYSIPGNTQITTKAQGSQLFVKDRTLAMLAEVNIIFESGLDKATDLNWDIASFPVWPEAPGVGMSPDTHVMVLSQTSKVKDDAFRVIATVVSDEVQMDMSRRGRFSVLKDPKIKQAFGQDMAFMKGKNIQAVYKTELAKPYEQTLYDTIAMSAIQKELSNVVLKGKDLNTALRDAEESVNKQIEKAESGK
jgi:multiple sugar transport system substrate-binding protein